MNRNSDRHLTERELIWSLVDKGELPSEVREHLAECPHCFSERAELEKRLSRLEQMVEDFSPTPAMRLEWHASSSGERREKLFTWRRVFILGACAVSVLFVLLRLDLFRSKPVHDLASIEKEMLVDERLLSVTARLERDALPTFYVEISNGGAFFDDEFIDFIVPESASGNGKHSNQFEDRKDSIC